MHAQRHFLRQHATEIACEAKRAARRAAAHNNAAR
jgi:hypothetical protein